MNNHKAIAHSINIKFLIITCIIVLILIGLVLILQLTLLGGVDYYYFFYPIAKLWFAGETQLYDEYSGSYGHLPWSVFLSIPFVLLPYEWGLGALRVFSLAVLVVSFVVFSLPGKPHVVIPAVVIFNLSTFDMIWRGQLEAFTTLGILLAWLGIYWVNPWVLGFGFIGLMLKPPTTIPIALYFLWLASQRWQVQKILQSFLLPGAIIILSFVLFGNWFPRWLVVVSTYSYPVFITTIWRAANQVGIPVIFPGLLAVLIVVLGILAWRKTNQWEGRQGDFAKLLLVITTTFSVTPYLLSYYFVSVLAIVLPSLAKWRLWVVMVLYLLTFLPLLRFSIGPENAWIDILFVLASFVAVFVFIYDKNAVPFTKDTN